MVNIEMQNIRWLAISGVVILLFVLIPQLIFYIGESFIQVEPMCVIKNYDQHPHNATLHIIDSSGEIYLEENYQLRSGESVSIQKPESILAWSNPLKSKEPENVSKEWDFYFESENISTNYSTVPHRVNTVNFNLVNDSNGFDIGIIEYT
ncbi:hypothetical protein [Methanococcoides methylutens]|nr:hypothetical protein [Methanococcoides methylutens]